MTWPISGPRARSYPAREYGQQPSSGTQPKRQSSPSIYKLHVNSPPTPGKPSPSTVPRQTQLRTATTTTTSNQNREHPPRRLPGERPSIGAEAATRGVPGGDPGQILRAKPKHPRVRAWGDPGQNTASKAEAPKGATPGGYGGKPPGVAFIGVPTGARNAGSGAPTGDQSTDMNGTRKPPGTCQDPITSASREKCRA